MIGSYDDIINLPHHVSNKHPHMPLEDRAAQFAPFAALTGHNAAVKETARLTDKQIELDENQIDLLCKKLNFIAEQIDNCPEVTITYFRADDKKDGGAYLSSTGYVKKINEYQRVIFMSDGTKIPIEAIIKIKGELLPKYL